MVHLKTRVFSFIALTGMFAGCTALAKEGYFVATDSFVAPAILSPDNDLVLDTKIKLEQILLEKGRAEQSLAECDGDIAAGKAAITELNGLKDFASNALAWTKTTTYQQASTGYADMQTLAAQKSALSKMLKRQSTLVDDSKKNLTAGLIQRQDYDRELQALDQVQIALFENVRTEMQSKLLLTQANMSQYSLRAGNKGSMPMPEQVMSMNMLITIECQALATEAALRAKVSERDRAKEELAKINTLEKELKARPIFRAIEQPLDIAFSPYTSLKGIAPGGKLMDCVWGVFHCKEVGKVVSIIPGETILPDIFGSGQVRGQFITLSLRKDMHDESMQSKVLRVRERKVVVGVRLAVK